MKIDVTARVDYLRWVVIGLLAAIYLVINLALPKLSLGAPVWTYLIQAVLWGAICLAVFRLPPSRPAAKIRIRHEIFQVALLIGLSQVMIYAIGGLFSGFGKSPYSFTPTGMAINFLYVGSMLAGMEFSRAWLVNHTSKRHATLTLTLVTIFYTLLSIPLLKLTGFKPEIQSLNTVGSEWLPLFTENLLATLLAMQAGARASLLYRGLLAAFWWFCPVLPALDWGLKAGIGVVMPIIGMLMVNRLTAAGSGHTRKWSNENAFPLGWIMAAIVCLAMVWFAVGLFPVKPSVIPTGSMEPLISPGDIVIIIKVSPDNIKLGDIIEYRTTTMNVVHRVIKIEENGNFLTKGDANSIADAEPVDPRNVIGKEMFIVPKVGWISIAIKQLFGG